MIEDPPLQLELIKIRGAPQFASVTYILRPYSPRIPRRIEFRTTGIRVIRRLLLTIVSRVPILDSVCDIYSLERVGCNYF